jgi:CRP/FNR family cyclic AMP-dependent transcriptional regulator
MDYYNYPGTEPKSSDAELVFLNYLTPKDWEELVSYSQTIHFLKDDFIFHAYDTDDVGDGVYILVTGKVEVIGKGTFGIKKSLAEINEGSVFGELSFFDRHPRSASIRALTDGQALNLTHAGFDRMATRNPALAQQFLFDLGRILTYRFRQLSATGI